MTPDLVIKRGDAGKIISGQFKDATGAAIDCSTHTNRKILMKRGSTLKINSTFTFTNALQGRWSYTLQTADVDTKGRYKLELEVTLAGPQVVTFPTDSDRPYLIVLIQGDLG